MASTVDQVTIRRRGAGLIAHDKALAGEGYTLFAPLTAEGGVYLVDMDGNLVHKWQMPTRAGRDAVLLPNGNLGYNGQLAGTPDRYPAWGLWHGGDFTEATPSGDVVWHYEDPLHHHDAQWLPNGNLLYGAMETLTPEFAARIVGGSADHDPPDGTRYGDVVKEVNRAGELVWSWRAAEHLNPADFPIHPIFDRYHWPLINGLWSSKSGLVLMSLRTTSGVIGVDRASGELAFHIPYGIVSQQHTPVELPNGHILIFDNGNLRNGRSNPYSRVIEVDPTSNTVTWEYADLTGPTFFSAFMGGAQRLSNGNTHICESANGRLFDVTPEGEVVWEYVIPYFAEYHPGAARYSPGLHNSVFRSHRYSISDVPWL